MICTKGKTRSPHDLWMLAILIGVEIWMGDQSLQSSLGDFTPPPKSLSNITFQVSWISGDLNTIWGFSRVSSLNKVNSRRDEQPLPGMYVNAETRRADTDEVHRNTQLWMRNLCHEHTQNKLLKWPKFIFKIKTTLSKLAMMQHTTRNIKTPMAEICHWMLFFGYTI